MPTLLVMRHAKSAWDTGRPDHQRPLNGRGYRNAHEMAAHLAPHHPIDRVLCSTSQRTRETLARLQDGGLQATEITFHDDIYEAAVSDILPLLRFLSDDADTVLLIGHWPGVEDLVLHLARRDDNQAWEPLLSKFVTAAVATIELDGPWSGLAPGRGRLVDFVTPRRRWA